MTFLNNPIDLAHFYWKGFLKPGSLALDATSGQGQDTLFLSTLCLQGHEGRVYACDIQEKAIEETQKRLSLNLSKNQIEKISLFQICHSKIDTLNIPSLDLVVYNLGYLPGSDKTITTNTETTLVSFEKALNLLKKGAFLSITCYPGHLEGSIETEEVLDWASKLNRDYNVCYHQWSNRSKKAPTLLMIQRKLALPSGNE
ncbi:MAG: hypothetical protein S4CHLAM7_07330 [Chlamydiae bacterium]|nr:hypothetical protein [Chlamydiota bacterium]